MIDYNEFCQNDITLRDYQQLAKKCIFSKWNVVDNILYQMPTGTGKTRLFTSIIRDISVWGLRRNINFRILIVAHRSELIEQSSRSLDKYHIRHGVLAGTMKEKCDMMQSIQVASIQTITHPSNRHFLEDLQFDFIIIDEAHHAVANSYKKLWDYCPYSKKLGVTATPWRMNNCGFTKIFDAYIPSMPIKEFISNGWLAAYHYYSIPSDSQIIRSIDSIREFDVDGDYKKSALVEAFDTSKIRAQLYNSYAKYAYGKKGIIYSISREHSEHICTQYRSRNISIESIDSKTPPQKREEIIKAFKRGEIEIIVNVDIFSEGFDCPDIEFIQLARPTKSLVKYIQQVGRGLRKNGSKKCIILDNVGMYSRFGLPDEDRDWESFFLGNPLDDVSSKKRQADSSHIINECQETDLSEGNEDMVLIQTIDIPQSTNSLGVPSIHEMLTNEANAKSEVEQIQESNDNCFIIRSSPFQSGKYIIEETEKGFFIVNTKTYNRMFLTRIQTMYGGSILVKKDKNTYTIIKTLSASKIHAASSYIIGTINKMGLLLKFTAFDKTILNMTITV